MNLFCFQSPNQAETPLASQDVAMLRHLVGTGKISPPGDEVPVMRVIHVVTSTVTLAWSLIYFLAEITR